MFTYVFVTLSIIQSQVIDKGFKKAENSEQNVVLLLFLFTLNGVVEHERGGLEAVLVLWLLPSSVPKQPVP